MHLCRRFFTPSSWLHLPRHTARMRLTLVYSGLFLFSGVALLTITNVLARQATQNGYYFRESDGVIVAGAKGSPTVMRPPADLPPQLQSQIKQIETQALRQHDADLEQLLVGSGIALAIMTVGSLAFGWVVAGRVLRPVRDITTTTRRISANNLHERLALDGPDDEFKALADTLDGLLGRLEASFESQRNFVANASHELRTPLTIQRTLIQVALADPNASVDSVRSVCEDVLACGEEQERIIEALLTLASSAQGLDHRELVDLVTITKDVMRTANPEIERGGLQVNTAIYPASIMGDPRLIRRLVANLVDNAVHHNVRHGHVDVATGTKEDHVVFSVENSGPKVPTDEVEQLFRPFQRVGHARASHQNGHGFGLSIVQAITTAHRAELVARSRPEGGLAVVLSFSAAPVETKAARAVEDRNRATGSLRASRGS